MSKRIVRGVGNINDFPDDVLCHIISLLPTKQAVCTSILSTRWRNLFTSLSNIDIEVRACNVNEWEPFKNFVDGLISHLHMPSVVRFRLKWVDCCSAHTKKKRFGGLNQRVRHWICALIPRHNIQEIDIDIDIGSGVYNSLVLPPDLFSCESLVVLKLKSDCLDKSMQKIPDRISLPNLKIIHFEGTKFSNDPENLFSSCPVLENLVLDRCFLGSFARFSISNQNLKTLTLRDISLDGSTRILINAPSLVTLNYHVKSRYSLECVDVKSLSEAIITCFECAPVGLFIPTPDAFGWIPNVKALSIYYFLARELKHSNVQIPLFEKMTYLKIWFGEFSTDPIGFNLIGLEHFLARCVVLETLVFEELHKLQLQPIIKPYSLRESRLAPLLHHLKTIEIRLRDIGHVKVLMEVIKFFLKSAKVLELLKISSKQGGQEEQLLIATIRTYPRASKICRVLLASDTSK